MERDKVRLGEQCVEILNLRGRAEGHEVQDIVVEHAHAEGFCKDGELRANMSVAYDSECLATNFPAACRDLVPDSSTHFVRTFKELTGKRDDFGNDEFGYGSRVGEGGVKDGNASSGCGLEIDLICADAEAADDQKLRDVS